MAEPNEYDLQREERIRRNKAMLAKLQVQQKADDVAAPLLAALQQKEAAKEAVRQKKNSAQEADFDPTDVTQQISSESDEDDLSQPSDGPEGHVQHSDPESVEDDTEDLQLQQALAMSLEGHAGRIGLVNPTEEEMKKAFSMFNSSNRSVISTQDISRVALEQGYNFDDDEINAMMEAAASVTGRASTTSMTFQGFQKLVAHYSRTAPT
ncbi:hypothetical protein WJX82_002917 [Trebouxia sp. C0006]